MSEPTPTPDAAPVVDASKLPSWLPDVLPVPRGAEVIGVGDQVCSVSVLVPGTDARVVAASLEEEGRSNGLGVRVVSSVTSAPPVSEGDLVDGAVPVELPPMHAVVLALATAEIDASVTVTSNGDGVVVAAYELLGKSCRLQGG